MKARLDIIHCSIKAHMHYSTPPKKKNKQTKNKTKQNKKKNQLVLFYSYKYNNGVGQIWKGYWQTSCFFDISIVALNQVEEHMPLSTLNLSHVFIWPARWQSLFSFSIGKLYGNLIGTKDLSLPILTRAGSSYTRAIPVPQESNVAEKCQTIPLGVAFSLYSQGLIHPNRQTRFKNNSPTLNQRETWCNAVTVCP